MRNENKDCFKFVQKLATIFPSRRFTRLKITVLLSLVPLVLVLPVAQSESDLSLSTFDHLQNISIHTFSSLFYLPPGLTKELEPEKGNSEEKEGE